MKKVLTAIFTGIVIGILIAPDSGAATRRKLASLIADTGDDDEDYFEEAGELIEHQLGSTKSRL